MVSQTILFGYAAVSWCLDALSEARKFQTAPNPSAFVPLPRLAAGALLPAALATFGLTTLLLFAHVRALGGANDVAATGGAAPAAADRRRRFVERLANATLAAAATALLAGAVLRLGAYGGYLGGDDVGWLWLGTE